MSVPGITCIFIKYLAHFFASGNVHKKKQQDKCIGGIMSTILTPDETELSEKAISFAEFLENHPPNNHVIVKNIFNEGSYGAGIKLIIPEIQLHCSNKDCNGIRFYSSISEDIFVNHRRLNDKFLSFECKNCELDLKTFSIRFDIINSEYAKVIKYGEIPPYGPPIPSRMIKLIGPDRDIFLRGRQCENHGLGIGAFTYYRRVVENQWCRFIESIIKVAKQSNTSKEMIDELEKSKGDFRFTKSVEDVKAAIPEALLINGHNPLTLLYTALSQGVHDLTDEECLDLASSIRVVLAELSEKISNALKDEKEIKDAVTRLLSKKE